MLKIFSRLPDRANHIIVKSPPDQFSSTEIQTTEIGEEIKPLNGYENAIIVSDDILDSSNSKKNHQFSFKRET